MSSGLSGKLASAWRLLHWRQLAVQRAFCPCCDRQRLFVRLRDDEIAIRCLHCHSSVVSLGMIDVLRRFVPGLAGLHVYELSTRGPLFHFLRQHSASLTASAWFPGVASGALHQGVLCQDVQALTFADHSFDVCTSTDVFEHVADDLAGFRNILRVLKPRGRLLFTVPFAPDQPTVERARLCDDNSIEYLKPAEYHGDPMSGTGRILAYRNYGQDLPARLQQAGFRRVMLVEPAVTYWGKSRTVFVAEK